MRIGAPPRGTTTASTRHGRIELLVLGALAVPLALYLGSLQRDGSDYSLWLDGVLGNVVLGGPALVLLGRAVLVRSRRVPYLLIGLAAASFTAGNIAYVSHVQFLDPVPYPSVADLGYLAPYPLLLAAVALLARRELRGMGVGPYLDGLVGASAVASAGAFLAVHPVVAELGGSRTAQVVGAVYPVADLTLASIIAGVMTLTGRRPGSTWLWLGSGVVTFAVADSVYLYRLANDSYAVGTLLDGLWAIGLTLMAVSAVRPYHPGGRRSGRSMGRLRLPVTFGLLALALLLYGSMSDRPLPWYAVLLTGLTLLLAGRRIVVGFSVLRRVAELQTGLRTDLLTQLPNRRHFDETVQQLLAARGGNEVVAVLVLDVDRFSRVNDTFGHAGGDELLRQIGPRLRGELQHGDLLARLGGDEFGVVLRRRDERGVHAFVDRLQRLAARPYLIEGIEHATGISVGVALAPHDGVDLAVLLQRAELALADAQHDGVPVARFAAERHGRDDINVHEALELHQLEVHYQPQFEIAPAGEERGSARMTGVEALVRWRHPVKGLLFPDAFLPYFEHAGLMAELTVEVLHVAARDHRAWRLDDRDLHLSVNLAPSALLKDDLVDDVRRVMSAHGLPSELLTLEITENVLLVDVERSMRTLNQLRELGIQLSLDDYGTGYCSLTYLRDLPLHEVKIDRSFVMQLQPDTTDAAIVASTLQLAKTLGLRTVAEGVENDEALGMLRDLGCDLVQGYLLGRPVPAGQLADAVPVVPRPRRPAAAHLN